MATWMYRPYLSILCAPYPVCGSPMWLDCIEATDKPDHDKRTYECVRCERTRTIIVKVGRARASTGELIR